MTANTLLALLALSAVLWGFCDALRNANGLLRTGRAR